MPPPPPPPPSGVSEASGFLPLGNGSEKRGDCDAEPAIVLVVSARETAGED